MRNIDGQAWGLTHEDPRTFRVPPAAPLQFILSGATAQVGHSHILTVTEAALYQSVLPTPTSSVRELRSKFDGTKIRPHPPRSSAAIHRRITGLLRTLTVDCTLHAKSNHLTIMKFPSANNYG